MLIELTKFILDFNVLKKVERVSHFMFGRTHITEDLGWEMDYYSGQKGSAALLELHLF